MVTISAIAYAVRTASESTPHPIKLSQAQQLVAAAFGYKSLAAYQASKEESKDLDDAAHFILDIELLSRRAQELKLPHMACEMAALLQNAFKERLPAAQLHPSEITLDGYVRDLVQNAILNHWGTNGAMAMTNNDGIDEIYLPFNEVVLADLPPPGDVLDEEFIGHVTMTVDTERPYCGHKIDVEARLVIERKGRVCIAEPACEVISAKLNWGGDDSEDNPPTVSLAQALADELDLELSEAEELVDAEPLDDQSDDGIVYRYVYDFSDYASPAVAKKLMAKYGDLQIEVPAWFFDRVTPSEYR